MGGPGNPRTNRLRGVSVAFWQSHCHRPDRPPDEARRTPPDGIAPPTPPGRSQARHPGPLPSWQRPGDCRQRPERTANPLSAAGLQRFQDGRRPFGAPIAPPMACGVHGCPGRQPRPVPSRAGIACRAGGRGLRESRADSSAPWRGMIRRAAASRPRVSTQFPPLPKRGPCRCLPARSPRARSPS